MGESPQGSVPPRGYAEFDYSGDVGVEAWGSTRAELIENATRGLFGLMAWSEATPEAAEPGAAPAASGRRAPAPAGAVDSRRFERPIDVHAYREADLLVDWLSAVILAAATHAEVYDQVSVASLDASSASGVVRGVAYDPSQHRLRFDVKAATYHNLLFESTDHGYHARVVFDL